MNVKLLIIILELVHNCKMDRARVRLEKIDHIIGRNQKRGSDKFEETDIRTIGQV